MPLTYTVRESPRAKHVSLKFSPSGSLEVVVPHGFDRARIPAILQKKQRWIDRIAQQVETQQAAWGSERADILPTQANLQAIDESWQIAYEPAQNFFAVRATEQPDRNLILYGAVDNHAICRSVLQRWMIYKARIHLIPWLRTVSKEIALPCQQISVRQQKTLWGSCSAKHAISLNCKLLFLPPELVRYVFIHELCHTIHLNHSADFWALVAHYEPRYHHLDRGLRDARYWVPLWMEG